MAQNVNKKRLVIRLVLVALLILLCFVLFYMGKEHEVFLDNKTVTIDGVKYEEIAYMNVIVDGDEDDSVEFYAGDRDIVKLQGPKHSFVVQVLDEDTEEVLKTVEYSLNLGTVSSVMYSLPAIVSGAENTELLLSHLQVQVEDDSDEGSQEDEGLPAADEMEGPSLSD